MKIFYNKGRYGLVLMVILALVLQIAGPIVSEYVYAGEDLEDLGEKIVDVEAEADGENAEGTLADEPVVDEQEDEATETEEMEKSEDGVRELDDEDSKHLERKTKEVRDVKPLAGGKDLGKGIFTDVKLKVSKTGNDDDYVEIEENKNTRIEIADGTIVRLEYEWIITNEVALQEGDWSKIKMPDVFKGHPSGMKGPLEGSVDGVKDVVGTYVIDDDNYLTVIFNDKLVGKEGRGGDVWAHMVFNENKINDDANQIIKFEDEIQKEFEITVIPGGKDDKVTKSGRPDKTINADYISWVIDVNLKLEELAYGIVEDIIPEGLGEAYDIEVYDLKVGADGSVKDNPTLTNPQPGNEKTTDGFKVTLGKTSSAYRIKYKTKVLDYSKDAYENIAILKDGTKEIDNGKWDIGELELGSTIDKKGKANNGGTNSDKITWTMDVNKAQLDLENVIVEDEFTETSGHELNISEIRIFKIDEHGNKQGENIASDFGTPTEFPVSLGHLKNQAIRIEYDTDIVYNEYKVSNIFTNSATLKVNGTQKGDSVTDTVTVGRLTLIEKKGVEGTSYGEPYIEWTLHINKAKHNIVNAIVKDTIGDGLKLLPDTIKIYKGDSYKIEDIYDGGSVTSSSDNSFMVSLGDIDDYYTIKYRTDIMDPSKALVNEGELFGDGLKGDGVGEDNIIKTGKIPPSNTVSNSYTKSKDINETIDGIKYDGLNHTEKTMSWKITVNTIKEQVTELTIIDIFEPANSMVFLKDDLRVVRRGSPDKILIKDTDYTLTDNKAGGFVLKFKGSHEPLERSKYEIFYKTSFDPDIVLDNGGVLNTGKEYKNTASFDGKVKDITGKVTEIVTLDEEADYDINDVVSKGGKKDGTLDRANRKIEWKVYANALARDLKGKRFIITDTIDQAVASSTDKKSGQQFDGSDIVVRTYSLEKDGNITPGEDIKSEEFTITYKTPDGTVTENASEADKFEIEFANGVDVPVMVEFSTDIKGISQEKYKNDVNITDKDKLNKDYSKEVEYEDSKVFIGKEASSVEGGMVYTDDEIEWTLTINKSLSEINKGAKVEDILSKGLVYLNRSLEIKSPSKTLVEDVDYTFTIDGKKLTITFTNAITEMYTITYKTAVTAGINDEINNVATINGEMGTAVDGEDKKYTIKQFSGGTGTGFTRGSIKIIKTDAEDSEEKLEDAEFKIYYFLNGNLEEPIIVKDAGGNLTHKTDSDGVIWLKGLVLGRTYFIKEVTAPDGYVLDSGVEAKEITLTNEEKKKDIELPFTNTKVTDAKGSIQFTKVGENQDVLVGAEFTLYDESDKKFEDPLQKETSGQDGLVKFENVPYGKYVIKETKAPEGYVLNIDNIEVEIKENGQEFVLDYDIDNKIIRGHIELIKKGNDGKLLKDAEFTLYDKADKVIQTATSDEDGLVRFEKVPYGDYIIKETKAPSGYYKNSIIYKVSIKANGTTVKQGENPSGNLVKIEVENTKIPPYVPSDPEGRIKIIKKDSDTEELLVGAEFDIIDSNGNIVDSLIIDETGQSTSENLPLGKYTIKETKAPEGYVLARETQEITITTGGEVKRLEFTNTKIRGNINLIKVDGEGKVLAGAEFALYDSKGEQVGQKVVSDEDGQVIFKDIPFGEYAIKETKAPKGYEMNEKEFKVAIEINGTTVVKDINGEDLRVENIIIPDPTDPTNPDPEDPDGSGDPGNPTDPEGPIGPENPGGPTNPNKPGGPTDPSKPTDPNKPGSPTYSDGDRLVQTGTDINFLIAIGTIILLMGVMFVYDGKRIKR